MTKLILNNINNIIDASTAQNTINANNDKIEASMENTLSRDGTSPNVMNSSLDMNSNQILNLAAPSGPNSAARLLDIITNQVGGFTEGNTFNTKTAASSVKIDTSFAFIITAGLNVVGDGLGGIYKKVGSNPGTSNSFQSLDGAWWDYSPDLSIQPITGAVYRPITSVIQDWVNVKDFGITYSGDEGALFQSILDTLNTSNISRLIIDGIITSSISITINQSDLEIRGTGGNSRKSGIISTLTNQPILTIAGDRVSVKNLLIYSSSTVVAGNLGVYWTGSDGVNEDLSILNCWDGLHCIGANLHSNRLVVSTFNGSGIISIGCIGGWYSNFSLIAGPAGNASYGTTGNIQMRDQNESVNFQFGECLAGNYSMITDSASIVLGTRNLLNMFTSVFFDGAVQGSYLSNMYSMEFHACEFSGGREGNTAGAKVINGRDIGFHGCKFINSGQSGLQAFGTQDLCISGGCAFDNGKASSGYNGIDLYSVEGFSVNGVRTGNGIIGAYGVWPDGNQNYGIGIQPGCLRGRVRDCGNEGNLLGNVYQGVTASSTMVYADNF